MMLFSMNMKGLEGSGHNMVHVLSWNQCDLVVRIGVLGELIQLPAGLTDLMTTK